MVVVPFSMWMLTDGPIFSEQLQEMVWLLPTCQLDPAIGDVTLILGVATLGVKVGAERCMGTLWEDLSAAEPTAPVATKMMDRTITAMLLRDTI
jgi:hypothetical protein